MVDKEVVYVYEMPPVDQMEDNKVYVKMRPKPNSKGPDSAKGKSICTCVCSLTPKEFAVKMSQMLRYRKT